MTRPVHADRTGRARPAGRVMGLCVIVLATAGPSPAGWLTPPPGQSSDKAPAAGQQAPAPSAQPDVSANLTDEQVRQAAETYRRLSQAGRQGDEQADAELARALAIGRQAAARLLAGTPDAEALIRFVGDWPQAPFLAPVLSRAATLADQELQAIDLDAQPPPRLLVRKYLMRWHGIDVPAVARALQRYDEMARPDFARIMALADPTARARQLAVFILQWSPSRLLAEARAERQRLADQCFQEICAIDDATQRRLRLSVFIRQFPDSRQVQQAREKLAMTGPAVAPPTTRPGTGSGGLSPVPAHNTPRTLVGQLELQRQEKIEHQQAEAVEHQVPEAVVRQARQVRQAGQVTRQARQARQAGQVDRQARQVNTPVRQVEQVPQGQNAQQARQATQARQTTGPQ